MNRQAVVNVLEFSRTSEKSDLLDSSLTTDTLIAFLSEILSARNGIWHRHLLVTAVRSDHPTQDGPNGHQGGNAIDFIEYTNASEHLIRDLQSCANARGIGLGGAYRQYAPPCGGYSEASKLFEDNDETHLHVQVLNY